MCSSRLPAFLRSCSWAQVDWWWFVRMKQNRKKRLQFVICWWLCFSKWYWCKMQPNGKEFFLNKKNMRLSCFNVRFVSRTLTLTILNVYWNCCVYELLLYVSHESFNIFVFAALNILYLAIVCGIFAYFYFYLNFWSI